MTSGRTFLAWKCRTRPTYACAASARDRAVAAEIAMAGIEQQPRRRAGRGHERVDLGRGLDNRAHVMVIDQRHPLRGVKAATLRPWRRSRPSRSAGSTGLLRQRRRVLALDGVRGLAGDADRAAHGLQLVEMRLDRGLLRLDRVRQEISEYQPETKASPWGARVGAAARRIVQGNGGRSRSRRSRSRRPRAGSALEGISAPRVWSSSFAQAMGLVPKRIIAVFLSSLRSHSRRPVELRRSALLRLSVVPHFRHRHIPPMPPADSAGGGIGVGVDDDDGRISAASFARSSAASSSAISRRPARHARPSPPHGRRSRSAAAATALGIAHRGC